MNDVINITLLIIFAVAGIGLGVGYNFLVIKKYPDNRRKGGYVVTVIVFFFVTVVLFSVISVKLYVDKALPAKSQELVEDIQKKHSNVGFVKNGLDLNGINNDVSKLNNAVADIKKVLPSNTDLGLTKGLYDFGVDALLKQLQKKLATVDFSGKTINSFVGDDNKLTISSIIKGFEKRIMRIINIVLIVFAAIFVLIFVIHIIKSLVIVSKERKNDTGFSGG